LAAEKWLSLQVNNSSADEDTMRWDVSCTRFVAFLDVMGFKSLVASTPTLDLYSLLKKLQREAALADRMARAIVGGERHGTAILLTSPDGDLQRSNRLLRVVQFSDAIILIARDNSDAASLGIRLACIRIFAAALSHGVAVRGAVAQGVVTADFRRSLFFGQPIVDSYLLEEDQRWFGIVEHESCFDAFPARHELSELKSNEIPISEVWSVETSAGPRELLALNWTILLSDEEQIDYLLRRHVAHKNEKVRTYARATREFAISGWRKYRRAAEPAVAADGRGGRSAPSRARR
jgi:hypothetical protein